MNKIPAKQIYMLTIIIVGIIALSIYSTYALFTFESSTSDIVSIHTPKSLKISENVYEYQQLVVEPNTITTTDIDIYNGFDYDVCYSIWYKVVGDIETENKIQVFESNSETLTSSGILTKGNNIRVTIAIINDNDKSIKVNVGTIGAKKENDSCSLNLASDKKLINTSYNKIETLSEKILNDREKIKEENASYLIYKNENKIITYKSTDKVYISEKFTYNNEVFTLEKPEELTIQELVDKNYIENKNIYFCKESDKCNTLYKITELEKQELEENIYNITLYDKLIGYSKGINGLRKINNQDYVFYGDNPNNFIYYNCKNNEDISTCELWRIVGLYYNPETAKYNIKIIRNDSIGKHQFDSNNSTNLWKTSTLYKYLNEEYKFLSNYNTYIDTYKQNGEILTTLDTTINNIKNQDEIIDSKVNIIKLSDYLYASSCQKNKISEYTADCFKNNWLNNLELTKEWTITTKKEEIVVGSPTEETEDENKTPEEIVQGNNIVNNYMYSIGSNITESNVADLLDVRPVIFLKSRMLIIKGDGTIDNPYIVK